MAGQQVTAQAPAQSKAERSYAFLKAGIADGRFPPGARLVLGAIARDLGVSVVPVREAIRLLEAEGLVTFERNIGAQVAMIDPTEYEATMQTLSLVEGFATALSAPLLTDDDLRRARTINTAMTDGLADFDPETFTRQNLDFHAVLFERCPNAHVLDLVHRGWARLGTLRASTFSFVPGRAAESVDEHESLLALIEQGAEPRDIEFCARDHRLGTLRAFQAAQHPEGER
jgi:DNA-binding GntR family transcriptional regulator